MVPEWTRERTAPWPCQESPESQPFGSRQDPLARARRKRGHCCAADWYASTQSCRAGSLRAGQSCTSLLGLGVWGVHLSHGGCLQRGSPSLNCGLRHLAKPRNSARDREEGQGGVARGDRGGCMGPGTARCEFPIGSSPPHTCLFPQQPALMGRPLPHSY